MSIDVAGVGAVADLVKDVADKIWPDPAQKAAAMLQVAQLDNQLAAGQAAIDQVEAGNNNLFVAGWRPFVGWCAGVAFAYHLVVEPLATYILAANGHVFPLPAFDNGTLSTILMGMLGLGVMRTVEKMGDKSHLPWQQGADTTDN